MKNRLLDISRVVLSLVFVLCAMVTILIFTNRSQSRKAVEPVRAQVLFTGPTSVMLMRETVASAQRGYISAYGKRAWMVDVGAASQLPSQVVFDAVNFSRDTLKLRIDEVDRMRDRKVPLVSANVFTASGAPAGDPWVYDDLSRVFITGLVDDAHEQFGGDWRITPPIDALLEVLAQMSKPIDVLVVLGDLSDEQVADLCKRVPRVHLLLLRDDRGIWPSPKLVNRTIIAGHPRGSPWVGNVTVVKDDKQMPPRVDDSVGQRTSGK